ncbi:GTP cyclohydrolase-2, partial [Protomyces lactucae-debilis]
KPLPKVVCNVRGRIPMVAGYEAFLHGYANDQDSKEHLAIVFGDHIHSKSLFKARPNETEMDRLARGAFEGQLWPGRTTSRLTDEQRAQLPEKIPPRDPPLARIHSECYTGETIGSARCDCGDQLNDAASLIAASGNGVIVYLRQEGRGIGLFEKMKAYNLQDLGNDTMEANLMLHHPADARDYGIATSILLDLGCTELDLLTNNPLKITAVEGPNKEVKVRRRIEMQPRTWQGKEGVHGEEFDKYISTKRDKMGHLL